MDSHVGELYELDEFAIRSIKEQWSDGASEGELNTTIGLEDYFGYWSIQIVKFKNKHLSCWESV